MFNLKTSTASAASDSAQSIFQRIHHASVQRQHCVHMYGMNVKQLAGSARFARGRGRGVRSATTSSTTCSSKPGGITSTQGNEVFVCTRPSCRKLGSRETLAWFKEMITATETGCLGECGKGPNVIIMPTEVIMNGVATPAQIAAVLEAQCGVRDASQALAECAASSALREKGNAALDAGDLDGALAAYTEALARYPLRSPHVMLGNRSAARLLAGDARGALDDAREAALAAPQWHKAHLRTADALWALGDAVGALAACRTAEVLEPGLKRSAKHNARVRQLLDRVPTPA